MKQQINLVKVRFLDNFTDPQNPREMFRPGLARQAVITNEKLIRNIVNHSGQKEAQVLAVLAALPDAVEDYATAGHSVQIDNLCTITPVVHCKAVETEAECNASTIKSVSVNVRPIGRSADLYKKWNFRMIDSIVEGEANGSDGGVVDPNENQQQENQQENNQQQGEQQQPVEKYTITYKHNDQVHTTQEYEVDATVTAPDAPDGYIWLNVPSRMPERNVTCESYEAGDPNDI